MFTSVSQYPKKSFHFFLAFLASTWEYHVDHSVDQFIP